MHQYLESDRQFELVMYIASLYIRKLPQGDQQAAILELATTWIDRGLEMVALLPPNHPRYHRHHFQVYYYQAEIQFVTGQMDLAYNLYFQANQFAKKARWQRFIYYTSGLMAIILTKQGEFARAERRLMTVLKYTDKYDDARAGALCLNHLAEVKKAQGDFGAARAFAERGKSRFKQLRMTREFKMMEQFLQTLDV
jgi:ATP/maltotriose-dependent transcriptional regulator MalT